MKERAPTGALVPFTCCRDILLLIHAGIPVLDLLYDVPSAPPHGHKYIHRIRFLSQPPYPFACSTGDLLCLPHELPWAQRMAFHRVCRTNVEYCCCARCPGYVRILSSPPIRMSLKPSRNSIRQRKGRILGLFAFLIVVGSLMLNTAMTIIATRASMANYPGGHALSLFNKRYAESSDGKSSSISHVTD
jgi:hypothetical protein